MEVSTRIPTNVSNPADKIANCVRCETGEVVMGVPSFLSFNLIHMDHVATGHC